MCHRTSKQRLKAATTARLAIAATTTRCRVLPAASAGLIADSWITPKCFERKRRLLWVFGASNGHKSDIAFMY